MSAKTIEPEWVDKVLEIIGHPEAWVSDRSCVWDFHWNQDPDSYADELSRKFGFKIYRNTYIYDIARELKRRSKV